jgi:hypothetical protein
MFEMLIAHSINPIHKKGGVKYSGIKIQEAIKRWTRGKQGQRGFFFSIVDVRRVGYVRCRQQT